MQLSQPVLSDDDTIIRDPDFRPHLDALGLKSAQEYVQWCAQRGLSTRIKKHWQERCRERFAASEELLDRRRKLARQQSRKPRQTLENLFVGNLAELDLTHPTLRLVHHLLISVDDESVKQSFKRLLIQVQAKSGLLSVQRAHTQLGEQSGNTLIEGMLALAKVNCRWIRKLTDWRPHSHNVYRQFSSLAAHLVGRYPVPVFMDSAWFRGSSDIATQQQEWYLALASGQSPRKMNFPIPLTKKMAHFFQQAPKELLIESALRWGQVLGLGGNAHLAKAILGSRLGANFEHNEFWVTVIRSLVEHPMLDTRQIGPIFDFIHHQKFEPQPMEVISGQITIQPLNPDFSMCGRTPLSLLTQMREWHIGLRKGTQKPNLQWLSSGIEPLELEEGSLVSGKPRKWTISELLNTWELFQEGQMMRHCVASYESSCVSGRSSIWSLSLERGDGRRKRVLTIEVSNQRKTICQIRGKANRLPNPKELELIKQWAKQEQLGIDGHIAP